MGFLKRFFSIGSKKGRRQRAQLQSLPMESTPELHRQEEQEQEAVASRLLRSSSTHFSVVSEVDYASLPPIPHPINTVSRTPTTSPTRAASIQTKNSYVVTIHGRTHHSHTEFPNAYPPLRDPFLTPNHARTAQHDSPARSKHIANPRKVPVTPRDINRLNRLRQDPSVASLLHMYDDQGCLDDKAFSNTPPPLPSPLSPQCDGRAQSRRRESTLRELMGGTDDEAFEGDISWAERCLGERNLSSSSLSTTSSVGLQTPATLFDTNTLSSDTTHKNITFSNETSSSTINYPFISSLEVELSTIIDSDDSPIINVDAKSPYKVHRTPSQRASQVFNFLTEKRQRPAQNRPLPLLPSSSSADDSTDSESSLPVTPNPDVLLSYPTFDGPTTPLHARELAALDLPPPPPSPAVFMPLRPPPPRTKARSMGAADVLREGPRVRTVTISASNLNVPTAEPEPVRMPKGPRQPTSSLNSNAATKGEDLNAQEVRRAFGELKNGSKSLAQDPKLKSTPADPASAYLYTQNSARPSHHRPLPETSRAPSVDIDVTKRKFTETESSVADPYTPKPPRVSHRRALSKPLRTQTIDIKVDSAKSNTNVPASTIHVTEKAIRREKENTCKSSKSDLSENTQFLLHPLPVPMTPIRIRALHQPSYGPNYAPSPASSSELSPEARQMMTDLRTKRMHARERDAAAQRHKAIRS